ncbi:LysM peptidoglycan-binding domain-containing protein [Luteimicrobium sp. DT211]|uniref:LysM peptidoglycan-binding domain-containing protein n=1 Tax=Luteimicrobium sp. DT211 TaxID=3393412 RepID=UPI003CEB0281
MAAFLLAGAGVLATGSAHAGAPSAGIEVTRHVVEPGESLWVLARSVAHPREDLRDVVAEIERLNHLAGAGLRAGEVVLLPASRG